MRVITACNKKALKLTASGPGLDLHRLSDNAPAYRFPTTPTSTMRTPCAAVMMKEIGSL
jgi:hypothetical protein